MPDYAGLTEKELLCMLKEKDHAAFNEIYNRSWKSLFNTAYKRLRDRLACEDIVHDVFADLWNKAAHAEIVNLQAYLGTAVRYKVYSLLSRGYHSAHFVEVFDHMLATEVNGETWVESKELQALLSLWIETLPKKRKEIFLLRYLEQLSSRDISERLGISQKTVQNQLLNAGYELQHHLRNYLPLIILAGYLGSR